MLSYRNLGILGATLCVTSFAGGRGCRPAPIKTVVTVHDVVHETSQTTTAATQTADAVRHSRIETKTLVTRPDGTRIISDRIATDGQVSETHTVATSVNNSTVSEAKDSKTVSTPIRLDPSWRLSLNLNWDAMNLRPRPDLRVDLAARLWGPFWAQTSIAPPVLGQSLNVRFGVALVFEF